MNTLEIVKWKSKAYVSDLEMIEAVDALVTDLKKLKGFISQTLYKNTEGYWMDLYYWESALDAHNSNDAMAETNSLKELLLLIEPQSITIEVLDPLQQS